MDARYKSVLKQLHPVEIIVIFWLLIAASLGMVRYGARWFSQHRRLLLLQTAHNSDSAQRKLARNNSRLRHLQPAVAVRPSTYKSERPKQFGTISHPPNNQPSLYEGPTNTMDAFSVRTLHVVLVSGNVMIVPASDNSLIKVILTRYLVDTTPQERSMLLSSGWMQGTRNGSDVTLACGIPNVPQYLVSRLTYVIHVPPSITLDVRSSDGNIAFKGTSADITAVSDKGNVTASVTGGSLAVGTSFGDIDITNQHPGGLLDVKTDHGTITVATGEADEPYAATLYSGGGSITFSGDAAQIQATTTTGDIFVNDKDLNSSVRSSIQSGSGNLYVVLNHGYAGGLNAQAGSGNISLPPDFTNGPPPPQLLLQTSKGAITVKSE